MSVSKIYPVNSNYQKHSLLNNDQYLAMYQRSLDHPEAFWAEQAESFIDWDKKWHTVMDVDYREAKISWFQGASLNVCYNCVDRHLSTRADQTAILWEGDDPDKSLAISYRELHREISKMANLLKARGVKKGDRVCIYMPMIPEVGYAMLACARIGAVHSVVFGGFSPESLKSRILDSDCQVVITADEGIRGARTVPLKANTDTALKGCPNVHSVIVVKYTGAKTAWDPKRDIDYYAEIQTISDQCPCEEMDAEDPLFILYTSGSTGKPKGVMHTSGGYLLFAAITHKYVFDYQDGDVYWCTADAGWITGHSYIFYGPLANGATTVVFEGIPTYPDAGRFWQVIDKHQVNIFYTAPTALRALMGKGNDFVTRSSRSSLRLLGTVGEPINPEAWEWYYHTVGETRCPIVDTWWQTETGGILLTPLPGATPLKPGSATRPFFGIKPAILDGQGKALKGEAEGALVMSQSWPGQMRTVYGDHQRFFDTYFSQYRGYYFTGDGARRDADGYYWITGRMDDVLNVSGHRLGTAEIESALVLHPMVAEAAVVGYPHPIKGQGVYAYVTLMSDVESSDSLKSELSELVKSEIGAIAKPDVIQWAPGLPKTRSGKIMRRILRTIAANEVENLGDISTLADPAVVEDLTQNRAHQ